MIVLTIQNIREYLRNSHRIPKGSQVTHTNKPLYFVFFTTVVLVTVVIFLTVVEAFATLAGATFFAAGAAFFGAGLEAAFFGIQTFTFNVTATILSFEDIDTLCFICAATGTTGFKHNEILGISIDHFTRTGSSVIFECVHRRYRSSSLCQAAPQLLSSGAIIPTTPTYFFFSCRKMQSGLRSMETSHKTMVILRCKLILVGTTQLLLSSVLNVLEK